MGKESGGLFSRLKNLILPEEGKKSTREISNNLILEELLNCFDESCLRESVGTSLLFNTHFLVILHPDTYEERLASFPIIVKEAVKAFYKRLQLLKKDYEDSTPVSSSWQFKFGPGIEFNQEIIEPHDIKIIGMLTGLKEVNMQQNTGPKNITTKVTMKSKATNVYDKMDINLQAIRHINFMQNGTFTVKFSNDLELGGSPVQQFLTTETGLARIECYLADKHEEQVYIMKDKEIVIARKDPENERYNNYLLIDSPYISNPHARIRYNDTSGKFQIASFSRNETRVNEIPVLKSEPANPQWVDLGDTSQILLNALVTLKFKNIQPV